MVTMLPRSLFIATLGMLLLAAVATADSDPLQDVCVADLTSGTKVNGYSCKENATPEDFFFAGLAKPGPTNNTMGSLVTAANVQKVPGLNTLGTSMSRIDYAPGGLNPPHTHPRASEIVYVLNGQLEVGFLTTANVLISKTIQQGEIFVFPKGLVHYQKNVGQGPAAVIAAFNSQLPGTQSIPTTLFASSPPVPDQILAQTFQFGVRDVQRIRSKLAPKQ